MSEFILAKVEIEETAATIAADREFIGAAVSAMKAARAEIERQIRRDQFFLTTFEPYDHKEDCSRVVKRMCEASAAVGVGPMATVAGVISQEALEAMVHEGLTHGWVDNGGDVALILDKPAVLEVFSEPNSRMAFALELEPSDRIVGVCSSSGRMGHSVSLGNSDIALAMADTAVLADALATAIGNRVQDASSLRTCFDPFRSVSGFVGGLAMIDGHASIHGRLPRLVEVEHNRDRLTVHSRMSSSKYVGHHGKCEEVRT
ncbi:MAG: UPF0280 family protein [Thermoplasmata archaeon]